MLTWLANTYDSNRRLVGSLFVSDEELYVERMYVVLEYIRDIARDRVTADLGPMYLRALMRTDVDPDT